MSNALETKVKVATIVGLDVCINTEHLKDWRDRTISEGSCRPDVRIVDVMVYIDGEKREFTFEEFKDRLGFTPMRNAK